MAHEPYMALYCDPSHRFVVYNELVKNVNVQGKATKETIKERVPNAICMGVRENPEELELICENVLVQGAYQGWCVAQMVFSPRDVYWYDHDILLDVPNGMNPHSGKGEFKLKMAKRKDRKRRRTMLNKDPQAYQVPLGEQVEDVEGAALGAALGDDSSAEQSMTIRFHPNLEPIILKLSSRPTGALAKFLKSNGEFTDKTNAVDKQLHLTEEQKHTLRGTIALEQNEYVSKLLTRLVKILAVNPIAKDELDELVADHMMFMTTGQMIDLCLTLIMGKKSDKKKVKLLDDQLEADLNLATIQAEKVMEDQLGSFGGSQSQQSNITTDTKIDTSEKGSFAESSLTSSKE